MKRIFLIISLSAFGIGCSSGGGGGSAATSSAAAAVVIKKAFTTSTSYNGTLGGFSGDTICAARATAAGLSGTWLAYLSYNGTTVPHANFTGNGPWYKMDGTTLIASNISDLADGTISASIGQNEFGVAVPNPGTNVWTGYDPNSVLPLVHCSGWTNAGGASSGVSGTVGPTGSTWVGNASTGCAATARIYCFEQ